MTSQWPADAIDHINGDKSDNRFHNLRDVTVKVNNQNMRESRCNNKSTGILGVYPDARGKKFRSSLTVDGCQHHLGTFDEAEQARVAYLDAKRNFHEGCTI